MAEPQVQHYERVVVRAPAKVNLFLGVGPPRSDGYHELATIYQAVSLYDEVSATHADPGAGPKVVVIGDEAHAVPTDERNLAWRAVRDLAAARGVAPDIEVRIRKGIPVAGGMAGGSTDAAGALRAADALWDLQAPEEELLELAAEIGSDVPFCLVGGTAMGLGRGEKVTPVLASGRYEWVFGLASEGLRTPTVYQVLDQLRTGKVTPEPVVPDDFLAALRSGDATRLARLWRNDLQRAALSLRPQLAELIEIGVDAGALAGIVSGSGPTVAWLVPDADTALRVTVSLSSSGLCAAVRSASGPVPGARVVNKQ